MLATALTAGGTEYPEYLVEETADDINEQVLVANDSGVWRYDVSSTNWTARGKFAEASGAKSVVQAGETIYVAVADNGAGRVLTFDLRGRAKGVFRTLDYVPTKLAVSPDGARLFVAGTGANGGVWRYPLTDTSEVKRLFTGQAVGVQATKHGTIYVAKAAASANNADALAAVGRSVNGNSASIYDAETGEWKVDSNFSGATEHSILYDADLNKVYLQLSNALLSRVTLNDEGVGSITDDQFKSLRENSSVNKSNYNYERTMSSKLVKHVKAKARMWFYSADGSGVAYEDLYNGRAPHVITGQVDGDLVAANDVVAVDLVRHKESYHDYVLVAGHLNGVKKYEVAADGSWIDKGYFCQDRSNFYAGGLARHGETVYVTVYDSGTRLSSIYRYSLKGRNLGRVTEDTRLPRALEVSDDGATLYVATSGSSLADSALYTIALTGEDAGEWTKITDNGSFSMALTRNGLIYIANTASSATTRPGGNGNYLSVYDAATGENVKNYDGTGGVINMTIDRGDNLLFKSFCSDNAFTVQPLKADGLLTDSADIGHAASAVEGWVDGRYVGPLKGKILRVGKRYYLYPCNNSPSTFQGALYRIHQWADMRHGAVKVSEGNMPFGWAFVTYRTSTWPNGTVIIVR